MTTFSIIIPCFNAEQTLPATLDAIRAQTHTDWEALCIDDGSSDATPEILKAYAARDPRIRPGRNDGRGPSRARNTAALTLARGAVLAFCDADDIWTPGKLAQLDACFEQTATDAAFGRIAFFRDQPVDARAQSTVPAADLSIPMLLAENPVCTMSNIAVRAHVFRATGGFDETMVHNEDLDWLIRLVGQGARVAGLDSLHTFYRTSPHGLSSDLRAMEEGRRTALRTAARFGHVPTRAAHAVYDRYLARRALRLGHGRLDALRLALRGLATSPAGFFNSPRRGLLTLLGSICAVFLPGGLSRALFTR